MGVFFFFKSLQMGTLSAKMIVGKGFEVWAPGQTKCL